MVYFKRCTLSCNMLFLYGPKLQKKKKKEGMNKLCSINCELETRLILVTLFDLTLMSSYRAVLAGHAFKSMRSFCFIKLTIIFVFLRHRNVFNKTFKREKWMGHNLLENCSDFPSRLGLVYMSMWVSCGGKVLCYCFVNLLGLCIRPYFSGCLKPHV